MRVCGVDLKGKCANLSIVKLHDGSPLVVECETKKIIVSDDTDCKALLTALETIKNFSSENKIRYFAIKARSKKGQMAGGAVSFKIETLFQISGTSVIFVNAVALSSFAKGNMAGLPDNLYQYQHDAYRCAVFHLNKL